MIRSVQTFSAVSRQIFILCVLGAVLSAVGCPGEDPGRDAGDTPDPESEPDAGTAGADAGPTRPGVSIVFADAPVLSEGAEALTMQVRLDAPPLDDVSVHVFESSTNQLAITPATLTFGPTDATLEQTVTLQALDDAVAEPTREVDITLSTEDSADVGYGVLASQVVRIDVQDDDEAGVVASPLSVSVTEGEAAATFTVQLASEPESAITLPVADDGDNAACVFSPPSLVFDASNWSAPQTITVTAIDDAVSDGTHTEVLTLGPALSGDQAYKNLTAAPVSVAILDNDSAGFTVEAMGTTVQEGGAMVTVAVALSTQPTSDVVIPLVASEPSEVVAMPAALVFSPADWATAQTMVLSALDDARPEAEASVVLHVGAPMSDDAAYAALAEQTLPLIVQDNDIAGVLIGALDGTVGEDGRSATFTLTLSAEPSAPVTLPVASSNLAEATVTPLELSFDVTSWAVPQTVTVTGVDDAVADGNAEVAINLGPLGSADAFFEGVTVPDVTVTNVDDETAGVSVAPLSGLVSESGTTSTLLVRLNTPPTQPVIIDVASADVGEVTLSPSQLIFTSGNWNYDQSIVLTGVDDPFTDGDIDVAVQFISVVSADPDYHQLPIPDVTVTNHDNDTAGVFISPLSGATSEDGTSATFSLHLLAEPTADVTFIFTSMDTSEASLSPASLTFNPANFSVDQTVTVSGVDDDILDGPQSFLIVTLPANSVDAAYDGLDPANLTGQNLDNDVAALDVHVVSATATEGAAPGLIRFKLTAAPASPVTLPVSASGPAGQAMLDVSEVTFDGADWNVPHDVNVTAVDDAAADGDVLYTLSFGSTTSADANFIGLTTGPIDINVLDNDVAGVTVFPSSGLLTDEAGKSALVHVRLTTPPAAAVDISLASADLDEVTFSPSALTFTSADWDVVQVVTLAGVDDATADGAQAFGVVFMPATSSDPAYDGVDPVDLVGVNAEAPAAAFTAGGHGVHCAGAADGSVACRGDNRFGQADVPAHAFSAVSLGERHACGVKTTGALACWGDSADGRTTPPGGSFSAIAAGRGHACALADDGTIHCFGDNGAGQTAAPGGAALAIGAGAAHSCALLTDQTLTCWGSNDDGRATPPPGTFASLSVGADHACARDLTDVVTCWGRNTWGEASAPAGSYSDVVAGDGFSCARSAGGVLTCWGNGADARTAPPAGTFVAHALGAAHGCARDAAGALTCWGNNDFGQHADAVVSPQWRAAGTAFCDGTRCWGATIPAGQLAAPEPSPNVIAVGETHACVSGTDTRCFGRDGAGATMLSGAATWLAAASDVTCGVVAGSIVCAGGAGPLAVAAAPAGTFDAVDVSASHACALSDVGNVTCWGDDAAGQASPPAGTFIALSVGASHSCALDVAGEVTCWGDDSAGQSSPLTGPFTALAAGAAHTCAIKTDGSGVCWGDNAMGQASPPSGTYETLSAGDAHTCALADDATLTCWGSNGYGESAAPSGAFGVLASGARANCALASTGDVMCWGDGATGAVSPPAGPVRGVAMADAFGCVVGQSGALSCWGDDAAGRTDPPAGTYDALTLGPDFGCALVEGSGAIDCWGQNALDQSTPPGGAYDTVASGAAFSCALDTSGAVACFGDDGAGQVSDAPAGVFVGLSVGASHACARDAVGAVVCWGDGASGQASVPSGAFADIACGAAHTCGLRPSGATTCWGDNAAGQGAPPMLPFVDVEARGDITCGRGADDAVFCWGGMRFD